MQLQLPFSPLLLSVTLLGVYGFCIFWLLKRENWRTLVALLLLTIGATFLHLHQIEVYPPGLNDDELKTLKSSHEFFNNRKIFVLAQQGPILPAILFQMPVVWWTDSAVWAMRAFPILFGILAVPLSFAVGRSLLFGAIPSLVVALLVATLPWSLFWGRISWGGEVFFYQALLLAALGRIIWRDGGKVEVVIGAIGLSGLLWDYTGAWSMLAMPFIGALLAFTWRQRALCLGVFALAIVLWVPYLLNINEWWHHITNKVSAGPSSPAVPLLSQIPELVGHFRFVLMRTLRAFHYPEGNVYWISMHSVAIHPTTVLVVAGLGALACLVRRSLFITLGFLAGLGPALLSFNGAASTHRMICAFIFISIACGALFEFLARSLKGRAGSAVTAGLAACFVTISSYQSISLFFSPTFWTQSERIFFSSETQLSESIRLPVTTPLAAAPQIARLLDARGVGIPGYVNLSYDNLLPPQAMTLTLTPDLEPLMPFYAEVLPAGQITSFGKAPYGTSMKLDFTSSDVEQWRKYGWTVERRCSDRVLRGIRVPVFYLHRTLGFGEPCPNQNELIFKAKWNRSPTELSIVTMGDTSVKISTSTGTTIVSTTDPKSPKKVTLHPDEIVTISVTSANAPNAWLAEGEALKLPRLDSFQPLP